MAIDEGRLKEALTLLFENYWILRKDMPKEYKLIRQLEKELRTVINEKFGFRFTVHTDFIKLEKIPVDAKAWMGLQSFQQKMDYVLFCCLLSILEDKETGEYFLLSHLCEELKMIYPKGERLDWVNYHHRRSFVRAMTEILNLHLLETLDGDLLRFTQDEEAEVLYRSTVYSRYFMRPYPQDIYQYANYKDLVEEDKIDPDEQNAVRYKVYRRLFLQPALLQSEISAEEFNYMRKYRQSIIDFVDSYTDYRFELYKDVGFLSIPDRRMNMVSFPTVRNIDDIVLHIANELYSQHLYELINSKIELSKEEWLSFLDKVIDRYHGGWSKEYREEKDKNKLSDEILKRCEEWEFIKQVGVKLIIHSTMVRSIGKYPKEFISS